jgi:hypothetical protein
MKDEMRNNDLTLTVLQRDELMQRFNHNIPWSPEFKEHDVFIGEKIIRLGFDDRKYLASGGDYVPKRPSR